MKLTPVTAIAALAGVGAVLYLVGAFDGFDLAGQDVEEVPQGVPLFEQAVLTLDPRTWDFTGFLDSTDPMNDPNVNAFLKVIRFSEGTAGPNGYQAIFATRGGPNFFNDFSDHPRVAKSFTANGKTLWTSAAGAYQFMAVSDLPSGGTTRVNTWDRLRAKLSLPDFSPASQDRAAVELISEAGALNDVKAGRFDQAISKCKGIWASLPGATYGQPTQKLADLRNVYQQAGGTRTA